MNARIASHQDHEPSANLELCLQRFRDFRPASRNDNSIIGRVVRPAVGSVVVQDVHVVIAEIGERGGGLLSQGPDAFDRVDIGRDLGEHGRRIARPGADLEHSFPALEGERLGHKGDDIGLRDGLPFVDRQRGILVGELLKLPRQESFAGTLRIAPRTFSDRTPRATMAFSTISLRSVENAVLAPPVVGCSAGPGR